ncbi:MAG: rhamnogalacturonan lyase [Prevotella sp.]|nr:rhamnogalacturonan lyase [Prevotella sp.]
MRIGKSFIISGLLTCMANVAMAQVTPTSQMEKLNRGLVVVPGNSGEFVSWRFLGTDDEDNTTFDVLRDNEVVGKDIAASTCFSDASGKSTNEYRIVTKVNGVAVDTTDAVKPRSDVYYKLKLDRPADGSDYSYSPNDCSVGDVDGDGEYELIVKWDPSNSKDNSQSGKTGNVFLDCYKFNGTKLWRIDLGVNIRAGAHYTQYLVYDFDGDGKAELICKTAQGSIDGVGNYVNQAATDASISGSSNKVDYRNSNGYILQGAEYLTVFNGETGAAIHTVWYNPNRNFGVGKAENYSSSWGDNYGNRGDRFLACVAYLDGADKNPSAVMVRGYYTQAYLWAVDFDGKELKTKWLHASTSKNYVELTIGDQKQPRKAYTKNTSGKSGGSCTMYGNGNHNISVADVDGDGCDEIIFGSAAINNDGTLLYATGLGHGDAIHLSDLIPSRPGLEMFQIHEESPYGWDVHDAATGEIIWRAEGDGDNGRGIAAQLQASEYGFYFSSSNDRQQRSATTGNVASTKSTSLNFRIYWDGDVQDELLDGTKIDKWNGNDTSRLYIKNKNPYDYNSSSSCNGTKSTPNLQADIFGDWREELILWSSADNATLNIFTTIDATSYRVPTLMHDHVYRMGVAWQNVAYNQPPHLGYYLPDRFKPRLVYQEGSSEEQTTQLGEDITPVVFKYLNTTSVVVDSTYTPNGVVKGLSSEFTRTVDFGAKQITLTGKPTVAGDYTIVLRLSGNTARPGYAYEYVKIHVDDLSGINDVETSSSPNGIYTVSGIKVPTKQVETLPSGIYVVKGQQGAKKVMVK